MDLFLNMHDKQDEKVTHTHTPHPEPKEMKRLEERLYHTAHIGQHTHQKYKNKKSYK
jgi:hypothetical protein